MLSHARTLIFTAQNCVTHTVNCDKMRPTILGFDVVNIMETAIGRKTRAAFQFGQTIQCKLTALTLFPNEGVKLLFLIVN